MNATIKISGLITLLLFLFTGTSAQKLKTEGYDISLKGYKEATTKNLGRMEKNLTGTVKVKGAASKEEVDFVFTSMNGKLNVLTFKDANNVIMAPPLYYNPRDKSFSYYPGTKREGRAKTVQNKSNEDLVLSGALIWMKLRTQ